MAASLLRDVNLNDILVDAAYDKEEVYKLLKDKTVYRPGINPRKNAIVKPDSS